MTFAEIFASFNIALLGLIVGAIGFFVFSTTSKNKKDKRKTLTYVWVIGLGVFLVGAFASIPALTNPIDFGQETLTTTDSGVVGGLSAGELCAVEDTTVTLSSVNKFTEVATGGTHRYRINNNPALTVSDTGTFTASPGDVLSIFWGNGSDETYFGAVDTFGIDCKGTQTFSSKRTQNGTISISVFNEEGNVIDGGAENETLSAGDVANLKIEIRGTNQQGFPHGGVLTLELNGTEYDEADSKLELGGLFVQKRSSSPQSHTLSDVANKVISWDIGAIEGAALIAGTLTLDVDSSTNPQDSNDPVLTFRPNDFFINEDNGGSFDGASVEDEDNVVTFNHVTTSTISVD